MGNVLAVQVDVADSRDTVEDEDVLLAGQRQLGAKPPVLAVEVDIRPERRRDRARDDRRAESEAVESVRVR